MGIRRHGDHWRWVGGPVPPGAAAITIGPLISLRRRYAGDERLLRHELVHVEQWRHHGVSGFLLRYLGAYVVWRLRAHAHWDAYRRIPFEVQATWRSRLAVPAGAPEPTPQKRSRPPPPGHPAPGRDTRPSGA